MTDITPPDRGSVLDVDMRLHNHLIMFNFIRYISTSGALPAKALGVLAKTDAWDAVVLARLGHSIQPTPRPWKDEET